MQSPVWRVHQSHAGELFGAEWVDAAQDEPLRAPRRTFVRLFPEQAWESTPGLEVAPLCAECGSGTVWRGRWECQGCSARGARQSTTVGGLPPALPREALAGAPIFSPSEGNNSTARAQWLWAVESLTSFHRQTQAGRLRWRGTTNKVEAIDEDGVVTQDVPAEPIIRQWHAQRIKGQAERFERVAACGTYENKLVITGEDGQVREQPIASKCDCWRVCQRCLSRRKYKLGKGMTEQREKAQRVYYRQASKWYRGREGKWSEKLITFTVPHGKLGPAEDARVLVDAWQQLLRRIRAHLVERGCIAVFKGADVEASNDGSHGAKPKARKPVAPSIPWNRALEVADRGEGGHAHLHVWWFGPYLESALLQIWWGAILKSKHVDVPRLSWSEFLSGARQKGHVPDGRIASWLGNPHPEHVFEWGIVHIIADRSGNGAVAAYSQKVGVALYVTKGTETQHLSPVHAASVYEVFEGTRAVQWARGWAPPKKPLRARCVSFRRLTDEEKSILNRRTVIQRITSKENSNANQGLQDIAVGGRGAAPGGSILSGAGSEASARVAAREKVGAARQLLLDVDTNKRASARKSW